MLHASQTWHQLRWAVGLHCCRHMLNQMKLDRLDDEVATWLLITTASYDKYVSRSGLEPAICRPTSQAARASSTHAPTNPVCVSTGGSSVLGQLQPMSKVTISFSDSVGLLSVWPKGTFILSRLIRPKPPSAYWSAREYN